MANTTKKEIEVTIEHPMEEVLDIEPGTTLIPKQERNTELIHIEQYDDKDSEIENQIQEVYDAAMDAYESQMDEVELVEGKFKARNGEVAVQFLKTALDAVKEKSILKQSKDKHLIAKNKLDSAKTVNNNLIVADRNELLKTLAEANKK